MNGSAVLDDLWRDVRFSLRTMLRRPAATAITLLTIALGIGATTAIFSLVNAVLFRPLPYPEPQALVGVWHASALSGRELDNIARLDDLRRGCRIALARLRARELTCPRSTRRPSIR